MAAFRGKISKMTGMKPTLEQILMLYPRAGLLPQIHHTVAGSPFQLAALGRGGNVSCTPLHYTGLMQRGAEIQMLLCDFFSLTVLVSWGLAVVSKCPAPATTPPSAAPMASPTGTSANSVLLWRKWRAWVRGGFLDQYCPFWHLEHKGVVWFTKQLHCAHSFSTCFPPKGTAWTWTWGAMDSATR